MKDNNIDLKGTLPEDITPSAELMAGNTPATETATAEPTPKYSDTFRDRIKSANPETDFTDDEAFFQKASEELDNLQQYRNNNQEANKALMEIFDAEPAVAEVLKDMVKGASFREAISRHFSQEELTPAEGDPDEEGWKNNAEERTNRLAGIEQRNKTQDENMEFSTRSIQEFAKETGLDEEKALEFLNTVGEALDEVYAGKISKSFLQSMWKALNHENDVKTAQVAGEIAGRNQTIETKKINKPSGDGLPTLSGNTPPPREPAKRDWVSNLIDNEKRKQIL